MSLHVLIIAAGLGTRMKSRRAKVLHQLVGKPVIGYRVKTALELNPSTLFVVVGHQAEMVSQTVQAEVTRLKGHEAPTVQFVLQAQQLGTGHAVKVARETLAGVQ